MKRNIIEFFVVIGAVIVILIGIGIWDANRSHAAASSWENCPLHTRSDSGYIGDWLDQDIAVSYRVRFRDCPFGVKPVRIIIRMAETNTVFGGWGMGEQGMLWHLAVTDDNVVRGVGDPWRRTVELPPKSGKYVRTIHPGAWWKAEHPRFCVWVKRRIEHYPDEAVHLSCRPLS